MGLFRTWKSKEPTINIDPCVYDPDARQLRAALEARDWKAARDYLDTVDDPDDRAFYISICADVPGVQDWIEEWIAADPDATLPLLVRGAHAVYWAWEARGTARAKDTSREQFRGFAQRLKLAEDCLDEVVERNPDDSTAWAFLVISARGRGVDRAEAQRRFDGVVRCHPGHLRAHQGMLQYLCQKWYGSNEEMFAFARKAAESASPGSPLAVLIAEAHVERWLSESDDKASAAYFKQPDVVRELNAAADRSVRHPGYRPRPGAVQLRNSFAFAFALAGDGQSAMEQFELIGDEVTEFPWCYLNTDPTKSFRILRRRAEKRANA